MNNDNTLETYEHEFPNFGTARWFEKRYERFGDDSLFYGVIARSKGYTREQCHILDTFVAQYGKSLEYKSLDTEQAYDLLASMKRTYLEFQDDFEPDSDTEAGIAGSIFKVTRIWCREVNDILDRQHATRLPY